MSTYWTDFALENSQLVPDLVGLIVLGIVELSHELRNVLRHGVCLSCVVIVIVFVVLVGLQSCRTYLSSTREACLC